VRPHTIRGTAAITVILATRIPSITRATSALAGEGTAGLGGGISTTAGIMAHGTGGADAAGAAADGVAIIDSESRLHAQQIALASTLNNPKQLSQSRRPPPTAP
jgi:hypothetical protein